MTYELTLSIQEDSPQGHNIETLAENEHISREQAALELLGLPELPQLRKASPTPDYLTIAKQAAQSPNCFKTREEADAYIGGLRTEW